MVNYDDLPLFPLHQVLFPEMPQSLHIFEPRYREMIRRCREENLPFGIVLIYNGSETGEASALYRVGTTARLTDYEELEDGRMNIVVTGETRFRIADTRQTHPYLSATVAPFWEQTSDPLLLQAPFDSVTALFKNYLKSLFALTNRPLSVLQLPQEPEHLSYAIASVLQVPLAEKQRLLEMTTTEERLRREIELLGQKVEAQKSLRAVQSDLRGGRNSTITPVDTQELGKLASRN